MAAARPGAALTEVDAAARDSSSEAGHGEHFRHGLGHGVGLEVHEAPMLGYESAGRLAARVPVTIEPGIYLPGMGGVRIEDILVVDGEREFRDPRPAHHDHQGAARAVAGRLCRLAHQENCTWPRRTT